MAMEGAAPLHHYLLAWHTWHMAHIKPHLFEEGDMLVLCALHPSPIFKKAKRGHFPRQLGVSNIPIEPTLRL